MYFKGYKNIKKRHYFPFLFHCKTWAKLNSQILNMAVQNPVHSTICWVHCTQYNMQCTLHTVQYLMYTVRSTVCRVHCTKYSMQCTLLSTLYTVPVMWIRSDPDSFGSVDPDPDSESGSGSRGKKSLIKWREKQSLINKNIFFSQEIKCFKSEP